MAEEEAKDKNHKQESFPLPLNSSPATSPRSRLALHYSGENERLKRYHRGWEDSVAKSPVHTFSEILRSEEKASSQLERWTCYNVFV